MIVQHEGGYTGERAGTALALGFFDGVHLGHRAVVNAAAGMNGGGSLDTAVFTFTVAGGGSPKGRMILSPEIKHRRLAELGVAFCFEPPFESFRGVDPEAFFYEGLLGAYQAKALCCGEDFRFGAKRAGDADLLRHLSAKEGIDFAVVPTALWRGGAVSSSRIRAALEEGRIEDANAMLGAPYEIEFEVHHGRGVGHKNGFPTINQVYPEEMQPPRTGVYITRAVVDGVAYPAATGYGSRPTVGGESPTCETFILGYEGTLYGQKIPVQFFKYIAETQKFSGPEELAAAVQAWGRQAVDFFRVGAEN